MTILSVEAYAALDKVATWLEAGAPHTSTAAGREIAEFDMQLGVVPQDSCGTACCIAGAVVQFENLGNPDNTGWIPFHGYDGVGQLAKDALELNYDQSQSLFLPWNDFVGEGVQESDFSDPALAALVVRHFMKTGVVDWRTPMKLGPKPE
jgi:hypothetical protein